MNHDEITIMPRRVQPAEKFIPTPKEIATLSALLQQAKQLGWEHNLSIGTLLFLIYGKCIHAPIMNLLFDASVRKQTIYDLKYHTSIETRYAFYAFSAGVLLATVPAMLYYYAFIFNMICSKITDHFPNGIGFRRDTSANQLLKEKLGSQADFQAAIKKTNTLIQQQKNHYNIFYTTLISSLLIPFITGNTSQTSAAQRFVRIQHYHHGFILKFTHLGFALTYESGTQENALLTPLANELAELLQAAHWTQWVYLSWTKRNTQDQLNTYANHLNTLNKTVVDKAPYWALVEDTENKYAAVYQLTFQSDAHLRLKNQTLKISPKDYRIELHRCLVQAGLPAMLSDNALYISYHDNTNHLKTLTIKLQTQLNHFTQCREESHHDKQMLNALMQGIAHSRDPWQRLMDLQNSGEWQALLYLDLEHIYSEKRDTLATLFNNAFPDNIELTDNCITLHCPLNKDNYTADILVEFNKLRKYTAKATPFAFIADSSDDRAAPADETHSTDVFLRTKFKSATKKQAVVPDGGQRAKTLTIQFSHGVTFDSIPFSKTKLLPDTFAYPCRMPHIPAGYAYVTVHPAVYDAVSEYLNKTRLQQILRNGHVFGYRQRGNKVGNIGLELIGQGDANNETYPGLDGKNHIAKLKLKAGNVRIWGTRKERLETGHVLYTLNGPAFGH